MNYVALANSNNVILKFEGIISRRAVNISINAQVLCTSRRQLDIASKFFTGYFA